MATHNNLGKYGEKLAEDYLINDGYEILERNFRVQKFEVDLLAKKAQTLAVIEVKTRSTTQFGHPKDFVKPKQIKHLVEAVNAYVIQELSLIHI